jgi:hypothetical protein
MPNYVPYVRVQERFTTHQRMITHPEQVMIQLVMDVGEKVGWR